ncbi:hypothetical protein MFIFM68171_01347 [Madurella fahalii]|uniref:Uncharacterized protein n=1 Tax=Madurella fahalii TaxID=1157608 RepID=A0ABQ0G047_9PEZI
MIADRGQIGPNWTGRLWCSIPYFYEETWSYLNGNIRILDKLPAVKAKALRKARDSKTPALVRKDFNLVSRGEAETLAWMSNPSQEALEQVLQARNIATQSSRTPGLPPSSNTLAFTPFQEMLDRATPHSLTRTSNTTLYRGSPLRKGADELIMNSYLQDLDIGNVKTESTTLVYDGLRSCPPLVADSSRAWRPYQGPDSHTRLCNARRHYSHAIKPPTSHPLPTEPSMSTTIRCPPNLKLVARPPRPQDHDPKALTSFTQKTVMPLKTPTLVCNKPLPPLPREIARPFPPSPYPSPIPITAPPLRALPRAPPV